MHQKGCKGNQDGVVGLLVIEEKEGKLFQDVQVYAALTIMW